MIEKILIPTDGSDSSHIALEYGLYVAKRLNAQQVKGLHVMDIRMMQGPVVTDLSGSMGMPSAQVFMPDLQRGLEERAENILHDFSLKCTEAGLHPETVASMGLIDDTIIEEGKHTDLIVLARKGEHFHIPGSMLGSTTESVVRKSGKPVMVTPGDFREIESMGLAYDGSKPAENALKLAVELSGAASWPLTIIIITDHHDRDADLISKLEDYLEPFTINAETIILSGKEDREIVKFIREGSIELMVMGAFGHNRFREFLLGSTTSRVIQNSPVPVLLTH
jgi:nucleotide-binding universal stress UspA family protein